MTLLHIWKKLNTKLGVVFIDINSNELFFNIAIGSVINLLKFVCLFVCTNALREKLYNLFVHLRPEKRVLFQSLKYFGQTKMSGEMSCPENRSSQGSWDKGSFNSI